MKREIIDLLSDSDNDEDFSDVIALAPPPSAKGIRSKTTDTSRAREINDHSDEGDEDLTNILDLIEEEEVKEALAQIEQLERQTPKKPNESTTTTNNNNNDSQSITEESSKLEKQSSTSSKRRRLSTNTTSKLIKDVLFGNDPSADDGATAAVMLQSLIIPNSLDQQWQNLKKASRSTYESQAMDILLQMTGLTAVKECFLKLYQKAVLAKEQNLPLDGFNFNTQFIGNPGTGKTTVANLFSHFLSDIGIFEEEIDIINTTGSELCNGGIDGLEEMLEDLQDNGGGVIFIDEAYQLNSGRGIPIVDFILCHSEKMKGKYGKIIWILAGYKKQMEDLMKLNPGLVSRFSEKYQFDDYTDEELQSILTGFFLRGGRDILPPKIKRKSDETSTQTKGKKGPTNAIPMTGGIMMPAGAGGRRGGRGAGRNKRGAAAATAMNPMMGMGMAYNMYNNRPDLKDQWGNTWKWDTTRNTYKDEYGNISGYGPNINNQYNIQFVLGDQNNPIVSQSTGICWLYNRATNLWYNRNNANMTSNLYPGMPPEEEETIDIPPEPFTVSDAKWIRIAARRIGRRRGVEGFGNAREIRKLFDIAHTRQIQRIMRLRYLGYSPGIRLFVRDDLLGPKATREALEGCAAWKELLAMEGLKEVKEAISSLLDLVITNADREEEEKKPLEVALNRIFLGNPGTGKTTVARLFARILGDLGLLSKGEVILRNASDFIGSALGKSEEVTKGILEQAHGCVLVIDEAYGLYQSFGTGVGGANEPYREAVINTLVEQIQGLPGEDRVVVMLGYREEMELMLSKCNPGLSRRFQLENAFIFQDYDDEALIRILSKTVERDGLKISPTTARFAVQQLARARARPHFGNAGAVNNLLSSAKLRMQKRISAASAASLLSSTVMTIDRELLVNEDFVPEGWTDEPITPEQLLTSFIGCDSIRAKLQHYLNLVTYHRTKGKDPKLILPFNFIFTGNPGTGKTTIARLMGKMFCSLGLIPTDEVIELSASDLMTGFAGQTGIKTRETFTNAKGKILFIDEAYQLHPQQGGQFMTEAVDEIVKCMTSEDYRRQLIIILAGYEKEMDDMLQVNAGLRSRFTERIHFDDFDEENIIQMIIAKLRVEDEAELSSAAADALQKEVAGQLKRLPGFSNGRDIETFVTKIVLAKVSRFHRNSEMDILVEDLLAALGEMRALKGLSKKDSTTAGTVAENNRSKKKAMTPAAPTATSTFLPPPPRAHQISVDMDMDMDQAAEAEEEIVEDEEWEQPEEDAARKKKPAGEEAISKAFDQDFDLTAEDWGDPRYNRLLQQLLEARGMNNEQSIRQLAFGMKTNDEDFQYLLQGLSNGFPSSSSAILADYLKEWQEKQKKLFKFKDETDKATQRAIAKGKKVLVPIWRCGVCGRADQPFIACYVAPFIVRYEPRPL